jgi:hypothetical protein
MSVRRSYNDSLKVIDDPWKVIFVVKIAGRLLIVNLWELTLITPQAISPIGRSII